MKDHSVGEKVLAVGLAGVAGFVDAVAFIELGGYFVSFMTGNTVQIGTGLAQDLSMAVLPLGLVALFVIGVAASSLVLHQAGRYRPPLALLLVTGLLVVAALAATNGNLWLAIAIMALAMGAENSVFERNGEVSIGLTYMTGALVKMGQGTAAAFRGGRHAAWLWHFSLWLGLAVGAVTGAFTFHAYGMQSLWFAAFVSLLCAIVSLLFVRPARAPGL